MFEIKKFVNKGDYNYAVVYDHPNATKHHYVLAHRVIVENNIGRLLTSSEIVHHKDHNKKNNDLDNLEVMDKHTHAKLHAKVGVTFVELECAFCKKTFKREKRQVKGKGLCSRSCNAKWNREYSSWKGNE